MAAESAEQAAPSLGQDAVIIDVEQQKGHITDCRKTQPMCIDPDERLEAVQRAASPGRRAHPWQHCPWYLRTSRGVLDTLMEVPMSCMSCGRTLNGAMAVGTLCPPCAQAQRAALHTLSRRALLVRAGALGASALTLPTLLACGATSSLAGVLGPTATPAAGTVTAGKATIQWFLTQRAAKQTTAAALAAQAQGYGGQLTSAYAAGLQQLTADLQAVGKVADQYDTPLQTALTQVGVDIKQLQADLAAFGKLTDPQQLAAAAKDLDAKYRPSFPKAYSVAGIDRDAIVAGMAKQILPRGSDPNLLTTSTEDTLITWGWTGSGSSSSPSPTDCGIVTTCTPPYDLTAGTGSATDVQVNAQTGDLTLVNSATVAGSSQQLASVGVTVPIGHAVTHLRVEADVYIGWGGTHAIATPGYASAEVILHLKLLDGATVLQDQSLSLARSIAAVFSWDDKEIVPGVRRLTLDYARPGGAPSDVNLSAIVEVETWAGAGALGTALAELRCGVNQIVVSNAC
jgi:hypothetical protein